MLKFQGIDKNGPLVRLNDRVVIPQQFGNETELIGEVVGLSVSTKNLITHVRVVLADGSISIMEVQSLIVHVADVFRSAPNIFREVGRFFSNLFRKRK